MRLSVAGTRQYSRAIPQRGPTQLDIIALAAANLGGHEGDAGTKETNHETRTGRRSSV